MHSLYTLKTLTDEQRTQIINEMQPEQLDDLMREIGLINHTYDTFHVSIRDGYFLVSITFHAYVNKPYGIVRASAEHRDFTQALKNALIEFINELIISE